MTTLDQFLGSESHKPFANWLQNQGVIRIASLKWETEATVEGLTRSTIKVRLRTAVRACLERLLLACKDLGVLKKHDVIGAIPLCRKIGLIYAGEGFRATSCQGNLLVTENDGKKAMESAVLAAVMAGRDSNSVEAHPALVAFLVKTGLNLIRRAARKELELLKEEQKKNDNIEWRRSPPDLADLVTDYLGRLTRLA
ncbi:MAG: hypothetical protein KVP17_001631 [Porospora cf. gigantea B]|nr:MAG: hypothetical protein KVP17_001631 [Porospora cf. gigantea B]